MPFGLTSAGSIYSRFISKVLEEGADPEHTSAYLDDIIIGTVEEQAQLRELAALFALHWKYGIKLNPKKTILFETTLEYLGHKMTSQGIAMIPEYIERILNWPQPTTVAELLWLLGFLNYYRSYIIWFAEHAAILNAQCNTKELEWTLR